MSKLINTQKSIINNQKVNAVSLRDLYLGLGLSDTQYPRWVKRNVIPNEFFIESRDWVISDQRSGSPQVGKPVVDYLITLDFAKHIALMAKTVKAHEYRNYFLTLEKTFEFIKFRRMDKKHQLDSMELIHDVLTDEEKQVTLNYIKANTVVNKLTSDMHKFPKMMKKADMSPEMLQTRQKVLDDYVKAFELTQENNMSNDMLRIMYNKQKLLGV